MHPSKYGARALDKARTDIILARLLDQGETSHKVLREQIIKDYLLAYTSRTVDHSDNARWGMIAQLWSLHGQAKIFRDIRKGTWILC